MLTRESFKGLYVLIITPMDEKFRVNFEGHRENIRKLVGLGIKPFYVGFVAALSVGILSVLGIFGLSLLGLN